MFSDGWCLKIIKYYFNLMQDNLYLITLNMYWYYLLFWRNGFGMLDAVVKNVFTELP